MVFVTGYVLEAVRKWKQRLNKLKIKSGECAEADLQSLDVKDPLFTLFTCNEAPAEDVVNLDHEGKEMTVIPAISKVEHIRRIKEASNKFLNISEKLEKVCPLGTHYGYSIYECGAVCAGLHKVK